MLGDSRDLRLQKNRRDGGEHRVAFSQNRRNSKGVEEAIGVRRLFIALVIVTVGSLAGQPGTSAAQAPPHPTLPECDPSDTSLLLPDLVPDAPAQPRNIQSGSRRVIQFGTAIANIGDGPFIIEGMTISTANGLVTQGYQQILRRDGSKCARVTGQFEYHAAHKHWHFDRFVGYELRKDDPVNGELATVGEKASFCLLDLARVRGYSEAEFPRQLTNLGCDSQEGIVGISVGWKDVYERFLPGQSINLDRSADNQVPPGPYVLVNVVDPDGLLWEKTRDNNRSFVPIGVTLEPNPFIAIPATTPRPHEPNLIPGRPRPLRPPRDARPTRPPRGPRPTPTPTPEPGATNGPSPPPVNPCANACPRNLSQLRLTWLDTGLNLTGTIGQGNGSPGCDGRMTPHEGDAGAVRMVNWLTAARTNTNKDHIANFVLDEGNTGMTQTNGSVRFSAGSHGLNIQYSAGVRPHSNMNDGLDFPVVFDLCIQLGNHAVSGRMVCQPKSRGMLCHEG